MEKINKGIILVILFTGIFIEGIMGCTTFLMSGKYTSNGRPLLFKQRDTGELDNKVEILPSGRFRCVGIVNSNDSVCREMYGGYNETGFAIINSATYNLNDPDEESEIENDGLIMRIALQNCNTLDDFERMLDSLPRPMLVSSNFGVIDAYGGAAYYETGNHGYTKFDANDKRVAPMGYLIRTNFSFTGRRKDDKGVARYNMASGLLEAAIQTGTLNSPFILNQVSRCLKHGITKEDLTQRIPEQNNPPLFVAFRDYIPRYITASVMLIEGTSANNKNQATTMWTILGFPFTSVAIPVWLTSKGDLPILIKPGENGKAPLCSWSLELKKTLFPIERGEGSDYLNLAAAITKNGTGIYQQIIPVEQQIWEKARTMQAQWKKSGVNPDNIDSFYRWVDQYLSELYSSRWNIR